jgi:hypothetical protein
MRDVFRADRLVGEAPLEGRPQGAVAMTLQQLVQVLDVVDPGPRTAVRELGQIRQRRRAQINQMLSLEIAPGALPRTAATRCARCSGRIEPSPTPNFRACSALNRPATLRTRSR